MEPADRIAGIRRNVLALSVVPKRNVNSFVVQYRKWAFVTLVIAALAMGAYLASPFVPSLLWATVMAVLVYPVNRRFRKRFSESGSALFTTLFTLMVIGIPLMLIGTIVVMQLTGYANDFAHGASGPSGGGADAIFAQIDDLVHPIANKLGADDFAAKVWLENNREALTKGLGAFASTAAKSTGQTLFALVVAFLTLFFLIRDGHKLRDPALELIPIPRAKAEDILGRMQTTINAVFISVVLVAVIQGVMAGVLYYFTGVPAPLLWMVVTMVLCTIPLLGGPVIYIPMALLLASQGHYVQAAVLAGVGLGIISNVDNVLRPYIIGSQVNLHPMAIFFSLLGGVFAFGPVGIVVGPVVLTVLLALQEIIRERLRPAELAKISAE